MPRYLLNVDGKISGPFSDTALQEMASVRAFDGSALLAPEATEDWKAVRDLPELHAQLFPPRKTISFKAKVIESLPETNNEPISVDQILHENVVVESKIPLKKGRRHVDRRRRDFLFALILLNGAVAAAWYYLPRDKDYDTIALAIAGLITGGLYWVFYQMMDRY